MKASLNQRYAHAEGHTAVKYTYDGSAIITAGSDSLIRVFKTAKEERDAAATTIDKHSEAIQSIAVHRSTFATAGDDGIVCLFGNHSLDFEKMLVRSTSAVRMISYSPSGTKIAVACDEETIRMFNVNDISIVIPVKGHRKFVKCVEFDPKGDYLVSSACDGEVRVWDLDSPEGGVSCVSALSSIAPTTDQDSNIRMTVSWRPDGTCFAVPGKDKDVILVARESWKSITSLNGHDEEITTLCWSPNGNYMATATTSGKVYIWDVTEKEIVADHKNGIEVSGLSWHPTGNVLAFTDRYGQMTTWEDVVPMQEKGLPHPAQAHARISNQEVDELFGDGPVRPNQPNGGEMDIAADIGDDMSDIDDFVIDDDGAGYAGPSKDINGYTAHQGSRENRTNQFWQQLLSPSQTAFQSGATPFKQVDAGGKPLEGERRYLAFNMVGVIYTIFQGTHSVVNVEFHDKSQNRNFHFQDYFNYSLAALGKKGAVFAVESSKTEQAPEGSDDDDEQAKSTNPSRIYYRPLGGLADNAEWSMRLPDGEEAMAIAVNDVSVIVATSANYIRIFSLSGLQVHIFNMASIMSVTAAADLALIVYLTGMSGAGKQNLECIVYNTEKLETIQRCALVTSPGSTIKWIGFSETSLPAVYDSKGILSVLFKQRRPDQATWVPVFDGDKAAKDRGLDEHYWPVGLLRDQLMCLVLKGRIEFPFFPRPIISNIELQMPFLHLESETTKLEESYVRSNVMSTHERDEATATSQEEVFLGILSKADIEMDKTLLRLIQFACKNEKPQRAVDLAKSLHLSRSVDAAVKIASHHRLPALAERFNQIKEAKFMSSVNDDLTSSFESQSLSQGPRIFSSSTSSLSSQLAFREPTPSLFSSSVRSIKLAQRKRDQMLSQDLDSDMDTIPGSPARKKSREGQSSPIPSRTAF